MGVTAGISVVDLERLTVIVGVSPVDPCGLIPPDVFEPNGSCSDAFDLGPGVFGGLHLALADVDYYRARVLPGDTLTAKLTPDSVNDWSAFYLRSAGPRCGPQYSGLPDPVILGSGTFINQWAPVSWTNTTARIQDVFILAREDFSSPVGGCWGYTLEVSGAAPVGTIGQAYCTGTPNSTGSVATSGAFGSSIASDNNVTLTASGMPSATFGIFLVSQNRDSDPTWNGGAGTLCLDEPIGRINGPGSVLQADASGSFEQALDLTAVPLAGMLLAVTPGDTLHFAAWHRDGAGGSASSNLTEGFTIWFE